MNWPFFLVCAWTLGCGIGVVTSRNPIYSAFNLVLTLFGVGLLYLFLSLPFLAVLQILIYSGAIVVLFVFVVMLLNLSYTPASLSPLSLLWGLVAAVAAWCCSWLGLFAFRRTLPSQPTVNGAHFDSLRALSQTLFTEYLWAFEVLSFFLLAIMAALYLLTYEPKPTPQKEASS